MITTTAKNYLHHMGIVTWQSRTPVAAQHPCYGYNLFDSAQHWCGIVLAEATTNTAQEQQLLQNIVQALGWTCQGEFYLDYPELDTQTLESKHVIFMGTAIAMHYQHAAALVTLTLQALLQQPLLKADLWRMLQRGVCV